MTKQESKITWDAGFENRNPDKPKEIKRLGKNQDERNDAEKPLKIAAEQDSGIKRLYRLAGYLIENSGS